MTPTDYCCDNSPGSPQDTTGQDSSGSLIPGYSPIARPDYSLQFGDGQDRSLQFGSGLQQVPSPAQLLQALIQLLSANPSYYPYSLITPDGQSFDQVTTIEMPTVGAGETLVNQLTAPDGYDGIVFGISNNVFGPSIDPSAPTLTWRIRNGASLSNSVFVPGYNNITVEFGQTNFLRPIKGIFLSSGQSLLYTIQNNDPSYPVGPATQTTCGFGGLFWPVQRSGK